MCWLAFQVASTRKDTMQIEWNGDIGTSDLCDIITKRMVWWIKLDNGQAAKVADVTVVINPFPLPHQTHYCNNEVTLSRPGLKYPAEEKAHADAVFAAGLWCGDMIAKANASLHLPTEAQRKEVR
jgi:hypothetical protein